MAIVIGIRTLVIARENLQKRPTLPRARPFSRPRVSVHARCREINMMRNKADRPRRVAAAAQTRSMHTPLSRAGATLSLRCGRSITEKSLIERSARARTVSDAAANARIFIAFEWTIRGLRS